MSGPRWARGVRLHEDRVRGRSVLLLPEWVAVPDARALAVLERVDGRSVDAIVEAVAQAYRAPVDEVGPDVRALLDRLDALGAFDWGRR